jgi:Ser/Thr protein kinase RdoA (MazF antagonist)
VTHLVHGMDGGPAAPVWPPLTEAEVRQLLSRYPVEADDAVIRWISPRPMSAAGLVEAADRVVFVKRHSPLVRSTARLQAEHEFAAWLRATGTPMPDVLSTNEGATVVDGPLGRYEVQTVIAGEDRYREAHSWTPYTKPTDAWSAGRALARFHDAATGFDRPEQPLEVLTDSVALITAPDPLAAIEAHVESRPVLSDYLGVRAWKAELRDALGPALDRATAAGLAEAAPLWTHGDWHPSNLAWKESAVVGVFDLGLANRTFAMHDLAIAVERSCVAWLSPERQVDGASLVGLLSGYRSVRPLTGEDRRHLAAGLAVAHVGYALSEVEYFAGPARSPADAELAHNSYLCGHGAGDAWLDVERIGQILP